MRSHPPQMGENAPEALYYKTSGGQCEDFYAVQWCKSNGIMYPSWSEFLLRLNCDDLVLAAILCKDNLT